MRSGDLFNKTNSEADNDSLLSQFNNHVTEFGQKKVFLQRVLNNLEKKYPLKTNDSKDAKQKTKFSNLTPIKQRQSTSATAASPAPDTKINAAPTEISSDDEILATYHRFTDFYKLPTDEQPSIEKANALLKALAAETTNEYSELLEIISDEDNYYDHYPKENPIAPQIESFRKKFLNGAESDQELETFETVYKKIAAFFGDFPNLTKPADIKAFCAKIQDMFDDGSDPETVNPYAAIIAMIDAQKLTADMIEPTSPHYSNLNVFYEKCRAALPPTHITTTTHQQPLPPSTPDQRKKTAPQSVNVECSPLPTYPVKNEKTLQEKIQDALEIDLTQKERATVPAKKIQILIAVLKSDQNIDYKDFTTQTVLKSFMVSLDALKSKYWPPTNVAASDDTQRLHRQNIHSTGLDQSSDPDSKHDGQIDEIGQHIVNLQIDAIAQHLIAIHAIDTSYRSNTPADRVDFSSAQSIETFLGSLNFKQLQKIITILESQETKLKNEADEKLHAEDLQKNKIIQNIMQNIALIQGYEAKMSQSDNSMISDIKIDTLNQQSLLSLSTLSKALASEEIRLNQQLAEIEMARKKQAEIDNEIQKITTLISEVKKLETEIVKVNADYKSLSSAALLEKDLPTFVHKSLDELQHISQRLGEDIEKLNSIKTQLTTAQVKGAPNTRTTKSSEPLVLKKVMQADAQETAEKKSIILSILGHISDIQSHNIQIQRLLPNYTSAFNTSHSLENMPLNELVALSTTVATVRNQASNLHTQSQAEANKKILEITTLISQIQRSETAIVAIKKDYNATATNTFSKNVLASLQNKSIDGLQSLSQTLQLELTQSQSFLAETQNAQIKQAEIDTEIKKITALISRVKQSETAIVAIQKEYKSTATANSSDNEPAALRKKSIAELQRLSQTLQSELTQSQTFLAETQNAQIKQAEIDKELEKIAALISGVKQSETEIVAIQKEYKSTATANSSDNEPAALRKKSIAELQRLSQTLQSELTQSQTFLAETQIAQIKQAEADKEIEKITTLISDVKRLETEIVAIHKEYKSTVTTTASENEPSVLKRKPIDELQRLSIKLTEEKEKLSKVKQGIVAEKAKLAAVAMATVRAKANSEKQRTSETSIATISKLIAQTAKPTTTSTPTAATATAAAPKRTSYHSAMSARRVDTSSLRPMAAAFAAQPHTSFGTPHLSAAPKNSLGPMTPVLMVPETPPPSKELKLAAGFQTPTKPLPSYITRAIKALKPPAAKNDAKDYEIQFNGLRDLAMLWLADQMRKKNYPKLDTSQFSNATIKHFQTKALTLKTLTGTAETIMITANFALCTRLASITAEDPNALESLKETIRGYEAVRNQIQQKNKPAFEIPKHAYLIKLHEHRWNQYVKKFAIKYCTLSNIDPTPENIEAIDAKFAYQLNEHKLKERSADEKIRHSLIELTEEWMLLTATVAASNDYSWEKNTADPRRNTDDELWIIHQKSKASCTSFLKKILGMNLNDQKESRKFKTEIQQFITTMKLGINHNKDSIPQYTEQEEKRHECIRICLSMKNIIQEKKTPGLDRGAVLHLNLGICIADNFILEAFKMNFADLKSPDNVDTTFRNFIRVVTDWQIQQQAPTPEQSRTPVVTKSTLFHALSVSPLKMRLNPTTPKLPSTATAAATPSTAKK